MLKLHWQFGTVVLSFVEGIAQNKAVCDVIAKRSISNLLRTLLWRCMYNKMFAMLPAKAFHIHVRKFNTFLDQGEVLEDLMLIKGNI